LLIPDSPLQTPRRSFEKPQIAERESFPANLEHARRRSRCTATAQWSPELFSGPFSRAGLKDLRDNDAAFS